MALSKIDSVWQATSGILTSQFFFATIGLQHPVLAKASAGLFDWSYFWKVLISGGNLQYQLVNALYCTPKYPKGEKNA